MDNAGAEAEAGSRQSAESSIVVFHKANQNEYYIFKDVFRDAVCESEKEQESEAGIQTYTSHKFGSIYRIGVGSDTKKLLNEARKTLEDQKLKLVIAVVSLPPRLTKDVLEYINIILKIIPEIHFQNNALLLLTNTSSVEKNLLQYFKKELELFEKHEKQNSFGHLLKIMCGESMSEEAVHTLVDRTVLWTKKPDAKAETFIKDKMDSFSNFTIEVVNIVVIYKSEERTFRDKLFPQNTRFIEILEMKGKELANRPFIYRPNGVAVNVYGININYLENNIGRIRRILDSNMFRAMVVINRQEPLEALWNIAKNLLLPETNQNLIFVNGSSCEKEKFETFLNRKNSGIHCLHPEQEPTDTSLVLDEILKKEFKDIRYQCKFYDDLWNKVISNAPKFQKDRTGSTKEALTDELKVEKDHLE